MRNLSKKSKMIIAGAAVAGLASTGVAFAYWTSTGTGSGSATTTTPTSSLVVVSSTAPSDLAPGVNAGPITVTVKNTAVSNAKAQQVIVSISSVVKATGAPAGTCVADDYTLSDAIMTAGALDLAQNATTTFTGASIGFNNTLANQDGCKGATVNLAFALS